MIVEFVNAWEQNKEKLEEYFRTHKQTEYCHDYENLVKLLFDIVINSGIEVDPIWTYNNKFDTDEITVIDNGDYQGTLIFILHKNTYQPDVSEHLYTHVNYGSCSGCDTLQAIHMYDYDKYPTEEQVQDYMMLCLHLLQNCHFMI